MADSRFDGGDADPDPYRIAGGYHIGDDILVSVQGQLVSGRVQGQDGPFVQVMLANGCSYYAQLDKIHAG